MFRSASSQLARALSVDRLLAILAVVCCCLALVTPVAGSGLENAGTVEPRTEAGAALDGGVDTDELTSTSITADLEDATGTVELVVRLEEADVSQSATDDETEAILEDQAEQTQGDVLEYANTTPGVHVQQQFWLTNAVVLEVDLDRVDPAGLERFDDVVDVHRNFEVAVPEPELLPETSDGEGESENGNEDEDTPHEPTPNPRYETTQPPAQLNAPEVWREYDTRGAGVRVAVLDTGIDVSHPDLELWTDDPTDPTYPGGWAAFEPDGTQDLGSTPHDSGTHGTAVSSLLAGQNATGRYLGVAPDVDLMHGQVLSEEGGTFAQLVAGMEWALEHDADVVSMSLGSAGTDDRLIEPVRNAKEAGVVVVAAVGNDGEDVSSSPANVYDSIAVGATTAEWEVPPFSGGEVIETDTAWNDPPSEWPSTYVVPTVVAPGVAVESAIPDGEYRHISGTSMATPHVAGVVALAQSASVDQSPADLERALLETTWYPDGVDSEPSTRYGQGIVDAKAATDRVASARLEGRVTDASGTAVPDATVTAGGESTTTDTTGSYALTTAPGSTTVAVDATGYVGTETEITVPAGATVTHDVTLERVEEGEYGTASGETSGSEQSPGLGVGGAVGAVAVVVVRLVFLGRRDGI
ncbi:S8 family serine peptidase [Halobacteria archaeon AArc-m2/3/4]|uniref:S8 family serine peptidase n=1 Tax=Natronoglomus mannanivorans TaxID=2979990 RepID=A0ABT2QEF3_9EURY|nr:S8 family serine peptidase [Halobacteria archaeon AArc-m2/3/4]